MPIIYSMDLNFRSFRLEAYFDRGSWFSQPSRGDGYS